MRVQLFKSDGLHRAGIIVSAGYLKGESGAFVQSIAFRQTDFTLEAAKKLLADGGISAEAHTEAGGYLRFELRPEAEFEAGTITRFEAGAPETKEPAEGDPKLYEIHDVEIFATGVWNGNRITGKDLDDIVEAFQKVGYRPPVKIGHGEKDGGKAFGWVKAIRRVGDKLVADFMDLPEKVYEAIKARHYDTVSIELLSNMKRAGTMFRRALKAVALLGAEIPAVNLKPLREATFLKSELAGALAIKFGVDAEGKIEGPDDEDDDTEDDDMKTQVETMQAKLDQQATEIAEMKLKQRRAELTAKLGALKVPAYRPFIEALLALAGDPRLSDAEAPLTFAIGEDKSLSGAQVVDKLIARINRDAETLFKETGKHIDQDGQHQFKNVAEELDFATREHMKKQNLGDDKYDAAMHAVLDANPDLKKRYAESN